MNILHVNFINDNRLILTRKRKTSDHQVVRHINISVERKENI